MRRVLRMNGVSMSVDNSVESALLIGSVVDSEDGTVGFVERVRPLDHISITSFFLLFDVTGVFIFNSVFVDVLRVVLIENKINKEKCLKLRWYLRKVLRGGSEFGQVLEQHVRWNHPENIHQVLEKTHHRVQSGLDCTICKMIRRDRHRNFHHLIHYSRRSRLRD
jgi:hypothetical protein